MTKGNQKETWFWNRSQLDIFSVHYFDGHRPEEVVDTAADRVLGDALKTDGDVLKEDRNVNVGQLSNLRLPDAQTQAR